jgi:hypothetical protein
MTYYTGEDMPEEINKAFKWAKAEVLDPLGEDAGTYLAGGAFLSYFTGKVVRDYDLFFENEYSLERVERHLRSNGYSDVYENSTVRSVGKDGICFDLVKSTIPTIEETLDGFDFTICMAGANFNQICIEENYFTHVATRSLVINSIDRPVHTIKRMQKYVQKGYSMDDTEIVKLAKVLLDYDFSDVDKQIQDNEAKYGLPVLTNYGTRNVIPVLAPARQTVSVGSINSGDYLFGS